MVVITEMFENMIEEDITEQNQTIVGIRLSSRYRRLVVIWIRSV